ncbi:hypothetical protein ABK040_004055 [Willaertia magna]
MVILSTVIIGEEEEESTTIPLQSSWWKENNNNCDSNNYNNHNNLTMKSSVMDYGTSREIPLEQIIHISSEEEDNIYYYYENNEEETNLLRKDNNNVTSLDLLPLDIITFDSIQSISQLPNDILSYLIFRYCDTSTLITLRLVCKNWKFLIEKQNSIWKVECEHTRLKIEGFIKENELFYHPTDLDNINTNTNNNLIINEMPANATEQRVANNNENNNLIEQEELLMTFNYPWLMDITTVNTTTNNSLSTFFVSDQPITTETSIRNIQNEAGNNFTINNAKFEKQDCLQSSNIPYFQYTLQLISNYYQLKKTLLFYSNFTNSHFYFIQKVYTLICYSLLFAFLGTSLITSYYLQYHTLAWWLFSFTFLYCLYISLILFIILPFLFINYLKFKIRKISKREFYKECIFYFSLFIIIVCIASFTTFLNLRFTYPTYKLVSKGWFMVLPLFLSTPFILTCLEVKRASPAEIRTSGLFLSAFGYCILALWFGFDLTWIIGFSLNFLIEIGAILICGIELIIRCMDCFLFFSWFKCLKIWLCSTIIIEALSLLTHHLLVILSVNYQLIDFGHSFIPLLVALIFLLPFIIYITKIKLPPPIIIKLQPTITVNTSIGGRGFVGGI